MDQRSTKRYSGVGNVGVSELHNVNFVVVTELEKNRLGSLHLVVIRAPTNIAVEARSLDLVSVFPELVFRGLPSSCILPHVHRDGEGEHVETGGILGRLERSGVPVENLHRASFVVAALVEHLPRLLPVHEASGGTVVVHDDISRVAVMSIVKGAESNVRLQDVFVPVAPRVRPVYDGRSLFCCVVAQ